MDLVGQPYPGRDDYNVSPTSQAWIIRNDPNDAGDLGTVQAQWWLIPSWVKEPGTKYSMFNARCENLMKSNAFRTPFQKQRCVLPISGFYEWKRSNNEKRPHYITSSDRQGLLLAGLWDSWTNRETGEVLDSFTIVTTDVAESLKFLHHRQPVMLSKDEARVWISNDTASDQLDELFRPRLAVPLDVVPVSTYVSNSRNRGPECIEPVGEAVQLEAV